MTLTVSGIDTLQPVVGVIAAGTGNVRSVLNAVRFLGFVPQELREPKHKRFSHLILPGVGSFQAGCRALSPAWRRFIDDHLRANGLLLGICLGMQLLFESSDESLGEGLALIPGKIQCLAGAIGPEIVLPRLGWRSVTYPHSYSGILGRPGQRSRYYFVHSYGFLGGSSDEETIVVNECGDRLPIAASVERGGQIYGVQYHPEKSSMYGLDVISNFLKHQCTG